MMVRRFAVRVEGWRSRFCLLGKLCENGADLSVLLFKRWVIKPTTANGNDRIGAGIKRIR